VKIKYSIQRSEKCW